MIGIWRFRIYLGNAYCFYLGVSLQTFGFQPRVFPGQAIRCNLFILRFAFRFRFIQIPKIKRISAAILNAMPENVRLFQNYSNPSQIRTVFLFSTLICMHFLIPRAAI